jgi:hypothetical protein
VPLLSSATTTTVPLNQVTGYFKFEYYKAPAGGNLAFDDLKIFSSIVGVNETLNNEEISVYPSPTTGILNIRLINSTPAMPAVEVFDMLGNKINGVNIERKGRGLYSLDLTGKSRGFYFVKIQTASQFVTRRITLTY